MIWGKQLKKRQKVRRIGRGLEDHPADLADMKNYLHYYPPSDGNIFDPGTWQDLELDRLFQKMNRTITLPGAQVLCRMMHTRERDGEKTERLHELIRTLQRDRSLRERLMIMLLPMRDIQGDLPAVLAGTWGKTPWFGSWLGLYPWIVLSMVTATFSHAAFALVLFPLLLFSWLLHLWLLAPMSEIIPECTQLVRLLSVSRSLGKIRDTELQALLDPCRIHRRRSGKTVRKLLWFYLDPDRFDEITGILMRYGKIFFLLDIIAFYRLKKYAERDRSIWQILFETVGYLDCALALAGFITDYSVMTRVEWAQRPRISAEGLYHPLIDQAQGNDITLENQSLLITGSNMSGKTSFIKTVGVNVWLSQTIGMAWAQRFVSCPFRVLSSIGREESLHDGKSYYFREIERILELISVPYGDEPVLFLIDEIYRGTNTAERLAASSAVLMELSKKGMVMVSTHDLELEAKLGMRFVMVHFREEVEAGKHFFSYHLHQGPCRSRNAIRLLQLVGYPEHVVRQAMNNLDSCCHPSFLAVQ